MPFTENTKLEAKECSHYTCVWCQQTNQFLEVHHITPEKEGGSDEIDNAAPLCPNCHTFIGDNTELRKQLRERRDWSWRRCAERRTPLPEEAAARRFNEVFTQLQTIEAQGGRTETLLTELKTTLVSQLQAQVTAVGSASSATQLVSAVQPSTAPPPQLTATVTFSGTNLVDGTPEQYHGYFVASTASSVAGADGQQHPGALVTIIPVAGERAGDTENLFIPRGTPEDGMNLARSMLRSLSQNQGLTEDYFPRSSRP